jgi:hypothetical protein
LNKNESVRTGEEELEGEGEEEKMEGAEDVEGIMLKSITK